VAEEDITETPEKPKINHLIIIVLVVQITGWHG
jgi:hypothetical protein